MARAVIFDKTVKRTPIGVICRLALDLVSSSSVPVTAEMSGAFVDFQVLGCSINAPASIYKLK